eukprot:10018898-Lingulodinium_polyedra.AAC.1
MPGPCTPGNRPGQRICMYHSRWPPARRASVSSHTSHACAAHCCERAVTTWNSGLASAPSRGNGGRL